MDDTLRQLLMVAPSLVASLRGQPEAMAAFMQGYERTRQEGEQSQIRRQSMAQQTDDRQYQRGRDVAEDARRAQDQTWQDTQRNVQVSGALQGAAEGADTPAQGESAIDALYRLLPPDAQATMAPSRDVALRGVAPTISRRHKSELQKLATEAEKSAFVQQADDAGQDPEFTEASPRMRQLMTELTGKPVFRLSDLRQAAELLKPAGKERVPAAAGSAEEYSDPKTTPERKAQILKDRKEFQTVDDRPRVDVHLDGLNPNQEANLSEKLGKDWNTATGPTREVERQFRLMETGLKRFRAGDKNGGSQAVLVTFQKILDPSSVVRESEYARSAAGISMLGRLQGYADKLQAGGAGVPDAELAQMVETARQMKDGMAQSTTAQRSRIEALAKKYKIAPEMIFGAESGGTAPPIGERRSFNGQLGEWDGTGWKPVK